MQLRIYWVHCCSPVHHRQWAAEPHHRCVDTSGFCLLVNYHSSTENGQVLAETQWRQTLEINKNRWRDKVGFSTLLLSTYLPLVCHPRLTLARLLRSAPPPPRMLGLRWSSAATREAAPPPRTWTRRPAGRARSRSGSTETSLDNQLESSICNSTYSCLSNLRNV